MTKINPLEIKCRKMGKEYNDLTFNTDLSKYIEKLQPNQYLTENDFKLNGSIKKSSNGFQTLLESFQYDLINNETQFEKAIQSALKNDEYKTTLEKYIIHNQSNKTICFTAFKDGYNMKLNQNLKIPQNIDKLVMEIEKKTYKNSSNKTSISKTQQQKISKEKSKSLSFEQLKIENDKYLEFIDNYEDEMEGILKDTFHNLDKNLKGDVRYEPYEGITLEDEWYNTFKIKYNNDYTYSITSSDLLQHVAEDYFDEINKKELIYDYSIDALSDIDEIDELNTSQKKELKHKFMERINVFKNELNTKYKSLLQGLNQNQIYKIVFVEDDLTIPIIEKTEPTFLQRYNKDLKEIREMMKKSEEYDKLKQQRFFNNMF